MNKLKSPDKPFEISKWAVMEAWEKVKANKGAPGVDEVTIEAFEADLQNNLYKVLEPDVVGELLPACGARGGNTQAARRRDPNARHTYHR